MSLLTRDITERLRVVIAHCHDEGMRTDVLEDALREIDRNRDVLKFYADPKTYERTHLGFTPGFGEHFQPAPITDDLHGSRARKALGPQSKFGSAPAYSVPSS
jgi:hypothetical protein